MSRAFIAVVSGLIFSLPTQASMVTLAGDSVEYSVDDALLGLFGMPTVVGDNLVFNPGGTSSNFFAESTNGAGLAVTGDSVDILVKPRAGFLLTGMSMVVERGDYLLQDPDGWVSVGLGMDVNGVTDSTSLIFEGDGWSKLYKDWEISTGIGVTATDLLDVTVSNTLSAFSGNYFGTAFIEKKLMTLSAVSVVDPGYSSSVPSPPVLWLWAIGLLPLMTARWSVRFR